MRASEIFKHRLTIVTGHYGTGKTEFSVNLAMTLAAEGEPLMFADLDIVNPYFRSRERKAEMEAAGIRVITSANSMNDADIPALPAELYSIFQSQDKRGLLDIGGDPSGARVLNRFGHDIRTQDYQMVYVVNGNRPEAKTVETAIYFLRGIEQTSGLKITGLINNTHLCEMTTVQDLYDGNELIQQVSKETGIPILCHTCNNKFIHEVEGIDEPLFPIDIYMKKPWEV